MRRFTKAPATAVLATLPAGGTAGWTSARGEETPSGALPGTAAWLADDALGRQLPDPATATPSEVAAFFGGLTETQQHRLVEDHPTVVGNLDGAPVNLRYEANASAGHQVLAHDPRGRGLVARSDLEHATHVSVIVPGSDIDLPTSDRTAQWASSICRR
ncbi:hypothetical protein ACLGIH_01265 [Streptomyces sp. HMX87]|uniref:hypothetical protein n=1 Tax=Streptomyces sp. HMX87 TaxID=3390849 RepID=UPI003A8AD849